MVPKGSLVASFARVYLTYDRELSLSEQLMPAGRVGACLELVSLQEASEQELWDVLWERSDRREDQGWRAADVEVDRERLIARFCDSEVPFTSSLNLNVCA